MNRKLLAAGALATSLLTGCATTSTTHINPEGMREYNANFSMNDCYAVANKMAQSIATATNVGNQTGEKPIIAFLEIQNSTSQHFDFEAVSDEMQKALLNTGLFRIENVRHGRALDQRVAEERQRAAGGTLTQDAASQWDAGEGAVRAQYFLSGKFSEDVQQSSTTRLRHYRIDFELTDRNREVVWMESMRMSKEEGRNWLFR